MLYGTDISKQDQLMLIPCLICCSDLCIFHIAHFMQQNQSIERTGACPHVLFKAKPYEMQIQGDPIYMIFAVSDAAFYTHKTL